MHITKKSSNRLTKTKLLEIKAILYDLRSNIKLIGKSKIFLENKIAIKTDIATIYSYRTHYPIFTQLGNSQSRKLKIKLKVT